jgi:hypothetical protein
METRVNQEPRVGSDRSPFDHWCEDHIEERAALTRSTRSANDAASFSATEFRDADVLSVHFADGSVFHTTPTNWLAHVSPVEAQGGARASSASAPSGNLIALPFELPSLSIAAAASRAGGNAGSAPIDRYALARLTESSSLDKIYQVGAWLADGVDRWFGSKAAPAAGMLAGKLCRAFENSVLHDALATRDGLLLWWNGQAWAPVTQARCWEGTAPGASAKRSAVLFLHGTGSSTEGSFSALRSNGRDASLATDFDSLARQHVLLAWEHRTLTCSPLANALGLAHALQAALPDDASPFTMHLVSHSRGGMVGDLLSLGLQAKAQQAAFRSLLNDFYTPEQNHPDQPLTNALADALERLAHLSAGTFVRVASPSRGTLLADRRTDLFLSLLLRSIAMAFGGNGNPWYERFNGLVRGLVAARADAKAIPGLEAMIPGSPLTLALNAMAAPSDYRQPLPALPGRLRVIAGDSAAAGLGGVFTLAADAFYGLHDHDFVVHTHSMFGGFARADAKSLRLEDKGVNHLGYFKPDALARGPLFAALSGQDEAFRSLAEDERATRGLMQALKSEPLCRVPREHWWQQLQDAARAQQPIVFVLPGIMGSELYLGPDEPVWLSPGAMLSGRLSHLNPQRDNHLQASALMPVAYERLLETASSRYRLLPWPYDWRDPIPHTAQRLRADLQEVLSRFVDVPVHLLAHSMGGLVSRCALFGSDDENEPDGVAAIGPALWRRLTQRGGRLLMLGTPNAGSYAPVQLLVQQHSLSHLLATMARKVSPEDLAEWGGMFGGLMQMLPARADAVYGDLFEVNTWAAMREDDGLTRVPDKATLDAAKRFRAWRDRQFESLKDEPHALYVAGSGATPCALLKPASLSGDAAALGGEGSALSAGNGLRFELSSQGDGVVSWASRLRPERTWYADCEHGDLADHSDAFAAYFELLDNGRSQGLPQTPPATRAAGRSADGRGLGLRPRGPALLPSLPADWSAYALGMHRGVQLPAAPLPIDVRVVHGGLDYARFPLIVGHYQNDAIMGGSRRVDEKLAGQLSRMVELKLFTGAERTSAYLRPPAEGTQAPAYPGAIVVGLGTVGELTPASLAASVTRAVLRFAFDHLHRDPWVPAEGPVLLRLSTLLVGTHVQAVSPRDSLSALLNGLWRANQHLLQAAAGRAMRVAEVEIIEIHEQAALDAAYELERLLKRAEWRERLAWAEPTLEERSGRLSGYRPNDSESVWQRLVVRQHSLGGLKFELIAERARVEATQVQSDVASLKSFIQQISDAGALGRSSAGDEDKTLGQVLYQMLLPQSLKGRMSHFDNTVLVLDDAASAYPWELMVPPEDDASPSDGVRPMAVQAGLVRQRVAYDFRALPTLASGCEALVVGAPGTDGWQDERGGPLRFSELPGALAEARAVQQWLAEDQRPWRCTMLLGKDAPFQRVRMALLAQPYRLLHLCGHGVVDFWVGEAGSGSEKQALRKTGMLLNNQQVLTAADVEQMGSVPEFVFINCCYSGQDGDESRLAPAQRAYPLLASSLALRFVQMGAKAVVAAGWQVEDADGLLFAESLYRALLQHNRSFGDAVREAREQVFLRGSGGNTWGAYQCYGDPAWRFAAPSAQRGYAHQFGTSRLRGAAKAMSHGELADRVLQVVALAGDKPKAALVMQIDELIQALRADPQRRSWLERSRIRSAFGQAFRELGEHERAVRWWQAGTRNAYSRVSLRELELLVNSLSRIGSADSHDVANHILEKLDAIDEPRLLYARDDSEVQPGLGARSERDALRGSDRMHRALRSEQASERARLYTEACGHFTTAYAGKLKPRDLAERRAYAMSGSMLCAGLALLNGATVKAVNQRIDLLRQHHGDQQGWEAHCQQLLEEIEGLGLSTSFWHYTNSFELMVARALLRLGIALAQQRGRSAAGAAPRERQLPAALLSETLAAELEGARRLMRNALVRWPSPAELESVRERYAHIQRGLDTVRNAPAPLQDALSQLRQHAQTAVQELDAGGRGRR